MRRTGIGTLAMTAVLTFGWVGTASADSRGRERQECDADREGSCNRSGDCNNSDAPCEDNDFSPTFDKSPVQDSFNPVICLPGATCNFDGGKGDAQKPAS